MGRWSLGMRLAQMLLSQQFFKCVFFQVVNRIPSRKKDEGTQPGIAEQLVQERYILLHQPATTQKNTKIWTATANLICK